ncbi:hypothetical protein [Desulfobacter sp.]|jgi:hypothetical protein|uniref:hypothetical protein n=1 Tax=Desulfobacter sp. TaxID=2294 RepID=UPI003D0C6D23
MPAMRNAVKLKTTRHDRKINLSGLKRIKIVAAGRHTVIKYIQGATGAQLPAMAPVAKERKIKSIGARVSLCLMSTYALLGWELSG